MKNKTYKVSTRTKTCVKCGTVEHVGKWAANLIYFSCIDCTENKPEEAKTLEDINSCVHYLRGMSHVLTQSARRGARILLSRYPHSEVERRAGREVRRNELETILPS